MTGMTLKTFTAPTMAEALAAVKKELGKDAVILHTRAYKVGGFLGFGAKPRVDVTASLGVNVPSRYGPGGLAGAGGVTNRGGPAGRKPAADDAELGGIAAVSPSAVAKAYGTPTVVVPSMRSAEAGRSAEPGRSGRSGGQVGGAAGVARDEVAAANARGSDNLSPNLADELAAIKVMVGQVLQASAVSGGGAPAAAMPRALLQHYLRLIQNDVSRHLADEVATAIRDELTPGELSDEGIVRTAVLRRLESLIPVEGGLAPAGPEADGRPRTIALVGPTGVGKTTTLAKLAAAFRLRHGKRVGLITCDTYRIAAVDQLRTYASIIGVPLKVALSPEEMAAACEELSDCDVILIDTAGRSPSDHERLDELSAMVDAARPHQVHLVLASVAGESSLVRTAERFARLRPDRVIFTKLDEAASLGVLLNVLNRLEAKLSFVTTGQEVPEDLEPGRADRLARLILDGWRPSGQRAAGVDAEAGLSREGSLSR
jgi:flagellar biosynthesis protein FlhF